MRATNVTWRPAYRWRPHPRVRRPWQSDCCWRGVATWLLASSLIVPAHALYCTLSDVSKQSRYAVDITTVLKGSFTTPPEKSQTYTANWCSTAMLRRCANHASSQRTERSRQRGPGPGPRCADHAGAVAGVVLADAVPRRLGAAGAGPAAAHARGGVTGWPTQARKQIQAPACNLVTCLDGY